MSVKTIGVVGSGQMGGGIAQVAAVSGLNVVVYDAFPGAVAKCQATHIKSLAKFVEKQKITLPVIVDKDGVPRVLDFGLARADEDGEAARNQVSPSAGATRAGEADDVPACLGGICRAHNGAAVGTHVVLQLGEEGRHVANVRAADLACAVAHLLKPVVAVHHLALLSPCGARRAQVGREPRVAHGLDRALAQSSRDVVVCHAALCAPPAGAHEPSTSEMWRARMGMPVRCARPAMCMRQPRSQATTSGAPLFMASCAFWSPRRPDSSG